MFLKLKKWDIEYGENYIFFKYAEKERLERNTSNGKEWLASALTFSYTFVTAQFSMF